MQQSGLDKAVILAQDAVYDERGCRDARNAFYVPNEYLFRVVARYPQVMIPCVSINPERGDALEELERCLAKGAAAVED